MEPGFMIWQIRITLALSERDERDIISSPGASLRLTAAKLELLTRRGDADIIDIDRLLALEGKAEQAR